MATALLLLLVLVVSMTTVTSEISYRNAGHKPTDCYDLLKLEGKTSNGVYTVYLGHEYGPQTAVQVYCDMKTDGGGWTVLMRRLDGTVNFYRPWIVYKEGFGNLEREFWLANDYIHLLTSNARQKLRVDLQDFEGNTAYAKYDNFHVGTEEEQYKLLTVGKYSGTAGDSLTYQVGQKFSTMDKDTKHKCAFKSNGAWWYRPRHCLCAHLTGLYMFGTTTETYNCLLWWTFRKPGYSLKFAEMKIRPYHI